MKILQVIPYFIPAYGYGGPVKVCFDVSRELVKNGHQVTVATTDTLDEKNRIARLSEEIDDIKIIRFRNISNKLAKKCNGYLPVGFYFWVRKNICRFDVVYCHDFFTLQNIIIAHFCKKYNVPFVVQPHGTLSLTRQKARFEIIKKVFIKLFRGVLNNSKNIIALTENEKKEISSIDKNFKHKIKIIPNGLKTEEFENIEKVNLYEKYNIPQKNKIIGYIGRLQFIKGIDLSLEILAQLKNKLKFTYLIIGPDEGERKNLEIQIEKLDLGSNVIFAGILTGKEKLETIHSCDLFLFTSRNEGFPLTVLEVAALGVPQIISKNCNVPEIERYMAGFEIDLEEKNKFLNKILEILNSPDLRENFSINSRKLIRQYFNLQNTSNLLEDCIKK
jgi:glycosyltransferase involved in cell wall biosynthesis